MRRITFGTALVMLAAMLAACGDDGAATTTAAPATSEAAATTQAPASTAAPSTTDGPAPPPEGVPPATTGTTDGPAPPPNTTPPVTNAPVTEGPVLFTDAFADQGDIPVAFTCDGANDVPGLRFDRVPDGTTSLALTVVDPDGGDWIHWVVWNIPPDTPAIGPDVPAGDLADGTRQGRNDFAQVFAAGESFPGGGDVRIDGWDGPCPPPGDPHRYVFTLYALTGTIDLPSGTPGADVLAAIEAARQDGSLIGEHTIIGLYPPG